MSNTTTAPGASPGSDSVLSRFVGVITSPKETYQGIVAHPKWFGMLALLCLVLAGLVGGFMMTQVGQDAWLEAATTGREISDQQYAGMERMAPYVGYITIAWMLVFMPILYLVVSGILFAVFSAAMGGTGTFKQLFAVVVHTGAVGVLGQLFTVPLNYARKSMTSATNLAVLLPRSVVPEGSFAAYLLGAIDVFLIWQLVVLAIGLGVLYRRKTQPIATTLFVIYAVVAVIIAVVRVSL